MSGQRRGSARRAGRAWWAWWADDRGLLSTELAVIMFPFIISCVAIVTYAGRVAQAEGDVQQAAQQAARAASLTGSADSAVAAARSVAAENLATARVACANGHDVVVHTDNFVPGGYVRVDVTCRARFSDVSHIAVPGAHTFTATATEIIDFYRSQNP